MVYACSKLNSGARDLGREFAGVIGNVCSSARHVYNSQTLLLLSLPSSIVGYWWILSYGHRAGKKFWNPLAQWVRKYFSFHLKYYLIYIILAINETHKTTNSYFTCRALFVLAENQNLLTQTKSSFCFFLHLRTVIIADNTVSYIS